MFPSARSHRSLLLALTVSGLVPAGQAWAACQRPVLVPSAPTGRLVTIDGNEVNGALPELLREIGREIGCEFRFPVMPRARLHQEVIEQGRMDLLLPAGRNSQRDAVAQFVPLLREQVALIVHRSDQSKAPASVAELRDRSKWRGALVRSYAFNDEYVGLVDALRAQQRADLVSDPPAAMRMLHAGRVQFSLMPPSALHDAAGPWRPGLQLLPLAGLPTMEFGVYLSRQSLADPDRQQIADALQRAVREGRVRAALLRHYPAELLDWAPPR